MTGRLATARDRGAVATVVAVLLAGGVLMGFAALAIDVGLLYAEREELVSGADAAALAIGRECSNDRPRCADEAALVSLASEYANDNASDGLANVQEVCGNLSGKLQSCTAGPANLTRCLGTPPSGPFVEVRLTTLLSGGRRLLPPVFAQSMAGDAGDGTEVRACARVTWERVNVLGMGIGDCELTNAATPLGPPYGPGDEYVVNFLEGQNTACGPVPGGSWLQVDHAGYLDSNGQCLTKVPENAEMHGDEPDITQPYEPTCGSALASLVGQAVWVPVFDAHRHPTTTRTDYRIVNVTKFVVTGYYFNNGPGEQMKSTLTNTLPCETTTGGPEYSCISGVFTGESMPLYTLTGDAIVRLVG